MMAGRGVVALTLAGVGAVCAGDASAAVIIRDRAWFNSKPHTFIDFEAKGDGTPVDLEFSEGEFQAWDEYESIGFVYDERAVVWQNFPPPSFGGSIAPQGGIGDAIDAIGSWPTAIAGGTAGWAIYFLTPVHAFGIGAVRASFTDLTDFTVLPQIHAFDAQGGLIGVLELSGEMIQGNFGGLFAGGAFGEIYNIEYGFMGLASSTPIARLEFVNAHWSVFDDLHFSAVPAPGAGVAFLLAGAMSLRRRR